MCVCVGGHLQLSETGKVEAAEAGDLLVDSGFSFDVVYTSVLKRAILTMWSILEKLDLHWVPVIKHWRLNERHYGALQGLNKAETAALHGEDQVKIWRRSYDVPPPSLEVSDERNPVNDRRYAGIPQQELPLAESLALTVDRVVPYWCALFFCCVASCELTPFLVEGVELWRP